MTSNNEDAGFRRTAMIEKRARELAAQWMRDDPLQYLYCIGADGLTADEKMLLAEWLRPDHDPSLAQALDTSAGQIIRKFVNDFAHAQGVRVAEATRGLMDDFDAKMEELKGRN